jgi:hypothetical protein
MDDLPVLASDTTFARVQARSFSNLVHWFDDFDEPPAAGQHVMAAGGGERLEAVVAQVSDEDGVIVLAFPQFAKDPQRFVVDLNVFGDSSKIEARVPRGLERLSVGEVVLVPGDSSDDRLFVVAGLSDGDRDALLVAV